MNELDSDLYLTEADIPPMEPQPTGGNPTKLNQRPKCGAVRNVCGTCRGCGLASDRIDGRTHFDDDRLLCGACCPVCRGAA